jgi:hypothetical protein
MVVWVGSIAAGTRQHSHSSSRSSRDLRPCFKCLTALLGMVERAREKLFHRKGEGERREESNNYVTGKQNERKYNKGERKE